VIVDNGHGVGAAVTHLIETHGAKHIAFIGGPSGSAEAKERIVAYRAALAAAGLQQDARFELDGDYTRPSGVAAVGTLLDERRVPAAALDALVAANDYMALGAMEELGRRGIHVPNEVAVVGFDDMASAGNPAAFIEPSSRFCAAWTAPKRIRASCRTCSRRCACTPLLASQAIRRRADG
jgi:LacI family transcriptional regulator